MPSLPVICEGLAAVAATLGVAFSGWRRVQLAFMAVASASACAGVVLGGSSGARGFASWIATTAGLGLLTFSAWNLISRQGERWAFRVVIYGFYAAAFSTAGALFAVHRPEAAITRGDWIACGAIYLASSILIASSKPWFAKRMLNER